MSELLLEIRSEEVPARMQKEACLELRRLVVAGLHAHGLDHSQCDSWATPQRMALLVSGLPKTQPDVTEERKGPRVGAPESAIEGFLRSVNMTLEQCERRSTDKGEVYFAVTHRKGQPSAEVLVRVIEQAINAVPWPKSMRWGNQTLRWVRPLHGLLCLFDGEILPVRLGELQAGRLTHGHRFMAPASISISDSADYLSKLSRAFVVLDPEKRKEIILKGAQDLAAKEGLSLRMDPELLEEVAGLVEWPVPLMGHFDSKYLDIPEEVLVSSMRSHQKYFSCLNEEGSLAPSFVVVANRLTKDGGKQVIAGNERVLRARLSDARFFWEQDLKTTLEARIDALAEMVFHQKLGSVKDKVERLAGLAERLAKQIPGADPALSRRAAFLCKSDLVSEMVYEFPEVQGVMGRYYALAQGEPKEVAEAIASHYAPQGPSDACPTAPNAVCVALADKLDTLNGFWSINEKPTGSKDPFALRRAALGVIRLIVENNLRLPLLDLIDGNRDLLAFFADRLKVHLKAKGLRHDLVSAVFDPGGEDDLVRLLARIYALEAFLKTDDGANLLIAHRRAANIVRIEHGRDGIDVDAEVDPDLCQQEEEKALLDALRVSEKAVSQALSNEDYETAMSALAQLRAPVDQFFDGVTVNDKDPDCRANRLRLLFRLGAASNPIADFSKIKG